jgi:hypothetical protein
LNVSISSCGQNNGAAIRLQVRRQPAEKVYVLLSRLHAILLVSRLSHSLAAVDATLLNEMEMQG